MRQSRKQPSYQPSNWTDGVSGGSSGPKKVEAKAVDVDPASFPDDKEILRCLKDLRPTMFPQYPAWRMDQVSKAFKKGGYKLLGDLKKDTKWHSWTKRKNDVAEDILSVMMGVATGNAVASGASSGPNKIGKNTKAVEKKQPEEKKVVVEGNCLACDKPATTEDGMQTPVGLYHTPCFRCAGCQRQLAMDAEDTNGDGIIDADEGKYKIKRDLAVCNAECAARAFCAKCDLAVGESDLGFEGKVYHEWCLVCAGCTKPVFEDLDGDGKISEDEIKFSMKQGQIVHDSACAALIFCGTCDAYIEGGQDAMEHDGYAYHIECFNCTNCDNSLPDGAYATLPDYPGHRFCSTCAQEFA